MCTLECYGTVKMELNSNKKEKNMLQFVYSEYVQKFAFYFD